MHDKVAFFRSGAEGGLGLRESASTLAKCTFAKHARAETRASYTRNLIVRDAKLVLEDPRFVCLPLSEDASLELLVEALDGLL